MNKTKIKAFFVTMVFAAGISAWNAQARTLDVATPSVEEIKARMATVDFSQMAVYAEMPVISGDYQPGVLTQDTQEAALNALNTVRFIAGIPANVTLDNTYIGYAQAGALVNAVNGKMEHKPENEHNMDAALFNTGYTGTSQGNLYWSGASAVSLNDAIVAGWMADDDGSNLASVGHRRWCLNPNMGKTGFGAVTGFDGTYACMYAFDRNGSSPVTTVIWPAQTMPTEYFGASYPWSISSDTGFAADTVVTLKRTRDGEEKTWTFSSAAADGHFAINNARYGMFGCVIFRPQDIGSYQEGDVFQVSVSENGSTSLEYTVNFFSRFGTPDQARLSFVYGSRGIKKGTGVTNWLKVMENGEENKTLTNDKINLTVDDPSIAEVLPRGDASNHFIIINGLSEGTTTVRASLKNGASASCQITVFPAEHVHKYEEKLIKEATCFWPEELWDEVCECGADNDDDGYMSRNVEVPHTPSCAEGTPEYCTEGQKCTVCGTILKEAAGHVWGGWQEVPSEDPGVTKWQRVCSVCNTVDEMTEETEPLPTPTDTPTVEPSDEPTDDPAGTPTENPTGEPTPTSDPTENPADDPAGTPTENPTGEPTPTSDPTENPADDPAGTPTESPTGEPTPTDAPTESPTAVPTAEPEDAPSAQPTSEPDILFRPVLQLSATNLVMKKGQTTNALCVTKMASEDKVKSVASSNKKVVKVLSFSKNGTIRLKALKTGQARITVKLGSDKTAVVKVKVQAGVVKTTKIKGITAKIILSKGKSHTLKPQILPITSQQKVTYTTSNKKVAVVNAKGKITAKKKGTAVITVKSGSKKVKCKVTVK